MTLPRKQKKLCGHCGVRLVVGKTITASRARGKFRICRVCEKEKRDARRRVKEAEGIYCRVCGAKLIIDQNWTSHSYICSPCVNPARVRSYRAKKASRSRKPMTVKEALSNPFILRSMDAPVTTIRVGLGED